MNGSDQEMVMNCLQGNETAWEDLMRSHERRVYSMSYRFTRCRAEAEDLTQDVFIRVYQTLSSFRSESGSLSGWLMQVARNLLIDRYRRLRRNLHFDPIRDADLSVSDPSAPNPLQCLTRDEIKTRVQAALRRLPPNTRNVIVLHDLEGLALAEVAVILHAPEGTVKSRMIRGRRELARILRSRVSRRKGPAPRSAEGTQTPIERLVPIAHSGWQAVPEFGANLG